MNTPVMINTAASSNRFRKPSFRAPRLGGAKVKSVGCPFFEGAAVLLNGNLFIAFMRQTPDNREANNRARQEHKQFEYRRKS